MKKYFTLFFVLFAAAFAAEKYGIYDSRGNRISTFEAELFDLSEKTKQIKQNNPNKILYVSSLEKGKSSKPTSRYRYKAEAGAYIEAAKKETFSVCPSNGIKGTWISKHSVALSAENCLSVQAPSLSGTSRILFLHDNGKTDTIQVLVNQSYIQMGDYSHRIWVADTNKQRRELITVFGNRYNARVGSYQSRAYNKNLIVDKTKLTIPEADYYINTYKHYLFFTDSITHEKHTSTKRKFLYPKNENFKESQLPYVEGFKFEIANERSKEEGLDTAYNYIYSSSNMENTTNIIRNSKNLVRLGNGRNFIDTSSSGYRLPYEDEWFYLMRAGASTKYYWGEEDDSLTVSRYAWISPLGVKPVAKLEPNKFGLYDMIGMTTELTIAFRSYGYNSIVPQCVGNDSYSECILIRKVQSLEERMERQPAGIECPGLIDLYRPLPENCIHIDETFKLVKRKSEYSSFRLVRETPKLQKLEKF